MMLKDGQTSILITGGAGFIGSNFISYFLNKHIRYRVINLDKMTYAASSDNLGEFMNGGRYEFVHGDIINSELVAHIFRQFNIRGVIHFAAESHVDNSIMNPRTFVKTNVMGTFTVLDCARNYWMNGKIEHEASRVDCRFVHVSTDEVFGTLGETGYFQESSPYAPNSPYSATKASSDLIVRSYFKTYGMNVITTNCSNNYGPRQHSEKLIPTIVRRALALQPIPVYGDGSNVRDWLYVDDHCEAIDLVFHKANAGESFNVGSNNEWNNLDLARSVCEILDGMAPQIISGSEYNSFSELIQFVKDRRGHDYRYAIDSTKIRNSLGWAPKTDFNEGLFRTVEWFFKKFS